MLLFDKAMKNNVWERVDMYFMSVPKQSLYKTSTVAFIHYTIKKWVGLSLFYETTFKKKRKKSFIKCHISGTICNI